MDARFTLLGTGSSGGVPRVGNDWGACDPAEPRNRRRRCCALLDAGDLSDPGQCTRILIDSSPDLREQLLDAQVRHLDALVYTHDHADQTHGIDDVRALALQMRNTVPTFMDAPTAASLNTRFEYVFKGKGGYPPILNQQPLIEVGTPFTVSGRGPDVHLLPVDQEHGRIRSLGFRIGNIAYCNDLNDLPGESIEALKGVDILIVDALRYTTHPSHANVEQSLAWVEQIAPEQAWLTNLHVDLDYQTLCQELPSHIRPAHDGLAIPFRL
ncbi:MBL fold metallo-hydrolase [Henriciella aquimarina]|uniref:MBL fold metallo-hydrolase n=1 Tax=Henriciella aquimarina TaxID=545261 RepID=UPI000A02AAC7|nr:MBL fold metallo-hydrolase [Henriciella aquimarina]